MLCCNIHNASITDKIGGGVFYNCFANPDGSGGLISTGSVTVGTPIGSTSP